MRKRIKSWEAQCRCWCYGVDDPRDVPNGDFYRDQVTKGICPITGRDFTVGRIVDDLPEWMESNLDLFPVRAQE